MRNRQLVILCAALLAALMSSCFTGIESTPKISTGDVRKRDAANQSAEERFMSDIAVESPSEWQAGKRFYVTDDKISIIFAHGSADATSLSGTDLIFKSFESIPSINGDGATQVIFEVDGRDGQYIYVVDSPVETLKARERLEIPFAIERSVVDAVDAALRGNTYYISTPKWHDALTNKAVDGQRHVPVKITRVEPGSYIYPLNVYFKQEGSDDERWIAMTIGSERAATRNFASVFNFDNPRKRYPRISDEDWALIINSKVREGMTRDECRLALGAPNSHRIIPVTNLVVEQWSYDDGVYLIFEEGILTRYRI